MKHVNFIMIAALLTLTVSCGKENKSGSKKVSSTVTNPIGSIGTIPTSNLDQASNQAFNNYKAWYTSSTEAGGVPAGTYELGYGQPQAPNCKEYLSGFFNLCYSKDIQTGFTPTCRVQITAGNMKPSNKILSSIATGKEGTLIRALQSSSLIELSFRKADNSIVVYTIDTRTHSMFQPIAKTVITASSSTTQQLTGVERDDFSLLQPCE